MSGEDRQKSPLAAIVSILVGIGLSVGVGFWALGTPGHDPVGNAILTARTAMSDSFDTLRSAPEDGHPDWDAASMALHDANAERGASLIAQHGCGSCHIVPGVSRAHGTVGPSLAGFRDRAYVAGVLPNRPGDLVDWLMRPSVHSPDTAMLDLGLTESEGRDMAAYLYTLRQDR